MDGPMTLSAKILAAHGVEDLTPGAFALARIDRVMLNDVSGAVSIREFEKMGATGVFDRERVACVVDHFWPAKDARSAALVARLRTFAERQGITDYWEVGATRDAGIEHAILAERGRIMPGRPPRRRGLAHLHERRLRRVRDRHGVERHRRGHGPRRGVAQGPRGRRGRVHGIARRARDRQGPDPRLHRTGGCRRRELRRAGVLRRGRRGAVARRAPRALQHGGRGRREDRDGRRGRDDAAVARRARARRPSPSHSPPIPARPTTGGRASTSTACGRWSPPPPPPATSTRSTSSPAT